MKLRRRSTRTASSAGTARPADSAEQQPAKPAATKLKSTVNSSATARTTTSATKSAAKATAQPAAKPPQQAKPKQQAKQPAKKPAPSTGAARQPASDNKVQRVAASTRRSSPPEKAKVVPAVKYESVKRAAGTKPVVDVFADPFGDAEESTQQSNQGAAGTTTERIVEDDVNPFADDEPIERLVKRQLEQEGTPQVPQIVDDLAQGQQPRLAPCPSPDSLKKIREIKVDIRSDSTDLPPECTLGDKPFEPRQFAATTYHWKASALCHKPLYFEDVNLERYGHSWGPILQPLVSGAEFFVTLPILPYKMGIEPPCECVYVLGYYRPGSCAPYMIFPVPLSIRGGLVEAGAVVGAVFIIP